MSTTSSTQTLAPRSGSSARKGLGLVLGLILGAALSACAVGPDFHRPDAPKGAGYTREPLTTETASTSLPGGAAQRLIEGIDIDAQWWTLFHSASLNALINEALKANPDLQAAQAALRQAQENAEADEGSFFPSVTASASGTRQKTSSATGSAPGKGSTPILNVASASLNVSYAPDVFGGNRRQLESADAQAEAQRYQVEATYITLTSNVVNTAIALASLNDQIKATEDIIKADTDQLQIVQQQYALGAVSRSDVLTQEAALAQTQATLPPLQKQLAQARNQLMAYLGRFPNQDDGESFELASLQLPEELPVSLPSSIVRQRPDVLAAEAQLHSASAQVGVATANEFPQFDITGSVGSSASTFGKLFTAGTGVWSLIASASQSIFDAGTLKHRQRAAVAAYDESAAQYRGTVIAAFQDVANALRAVETDADALKAEAQAEQAALASLELARAQYRLGAINYLSLLNAEQTYQNAVLGRVRAQATRYSDTVALFQALGGGWWNQTQDVAGNPSPAANAGDKSSKK